MNPPIRPDADPEAWSRISSILDRVLDEEPSGREAAVVAACGEDEALCARLLEIVRLVGGDAFLDADALSFAAPAWQEDLGGEPLAPGRRIGAYRILKRLAVGGMSLVYLVERSDDQFHRTCVLKVLDDTGLDPGAAMRRFQAERRILAALDHPNIAAVYDGGTTEDGRPYLILEYVDGEPITAYCARLGLPLAARLALFRTVCRAVEHAHRRFVVHRDLKPGNIFVRADGAVKLLDFGIAKLLDPTGPDELPLTRTGLRLLTPEYAAPEQVREGAITTATDVYSLGVLLYELATGHRPYDLANRSPAAVEQVICDDDPPRPSARAIEPGPGAPGDGGLARRLRGDLDTIVMTALAKEPGRRYGSPGALADDLERHTEGLPVSARSASLGYRMRRSVRRHRVAAAAALAAVLSVAAFGTFHVVQITEERNAARREAERAGQIASFLQDLFEVSDPDVSHGETITARDLLDRAAPRLREELAGQPDVRADMLMALGEVYHKLSLYPSARALAEEAYGIRIDAFGEESAEAAESLDLLARCALQEGAYAAVDSLLERVLRLQTTHRGARSPEAARSLYWLGVSSLNQNRYARADSLLRASLGMWRALPPGHELDEALALKDIGNVQTALGNYAAAEPLLREALDTRRRLLGENHSAVYVAMTNLGDNLSMQGRSDEAVPLLREGTDGLERLLGSRHSEVAEALNVLGITLLNAGRYAEAEAPLRRALAIRRDLHGENHPDVARGLNDLGTLHVYREDFAAAVPILREALAVNRALLGDRDLAVGIGFTNLASALRGIGAYDEADARFREAEAVYAALDGPDGVRAVAARFGQASVLQERGALAESERRYRDLYPRYRELHPNGGRRLYEFLLAFGRLLHATGRDPEALPLLEEAAEGYATVMGEASLTTARARVALAGCLGDLAHYERADSLLRAGLAAQHAALPPDHPQLAISGRIAAQLYEAWGRPAEAARFKSPARGD